MTPEEAERIERLFAAALEQRGGSRERFLSSIPAPERSEVLSLLEAHDAAGRLDRIAEKLSAMQADPPAISFSELRTRLDPALSGRYRVEREVARGGMAIVLLAEDLKHRRRVALKVLQPRIALSIGPTRFVQEIEIAARLAHPHILPLHDSGEAAGLLYYVMPYVPDESLRDRLRRERRLPLTEALEITCQVAHALSYSHRQGVVHCDIKPENILLQAGQAVVTDFGIARAVVSGSADGEPGPVLGTLAYMSPEQATPGQGIDRRSDLYSLGCVLYEMLAGEPPFHSAELPGNVPAPVRAAIHRVLALKRDDRFETADEFIRSLAPPDAEPIPGRPAPRRAWYAGLALAVTLAGAGIVLDGLRAPLVPAAAVIAVLPPTSISGDTLHLRLARDLVVTLSTNLGSGGTIRTVDALTVLAQTRESGQLGLEQGIQLARLLGASSVVHGSIVAAGSKVRLDLGLFTTDAGLPIARASIEGDPDDLMGLSDTLTRQLLRDVWRSRAPPRPSLATNTTGSLSALRAFLEGERASLENRWDGAATAYARAMVEDPTFWLASWRWSFARWWYLEAVDDTVIEQLYQHRAELPERDRLVFESWWTDSIPLALDLGRQAVERYPDHWPGWMQYGDWLFHSGPVYGHDPVEAQAALERAVALNPAFAAAWEHLYWSTIGRDSAAAARALDGLIRAGFERASTTEFGYDLTRSYRLELQLARTGRLDTPALDSLASDIIRSGSSRVGGGFSLLLPQVELARRILTHHPSASVAGLAERILADGWAGRGAWDSAVFVAARHAARSESADPLGSYRLAVVGAWVGALAPDAAARRRPVVTSDSPGWNRMLRAELAWLDGLLAVSRGDSAALREAGSRVRQTDTLTSGVLVQSLEAFGRSLTGDYVEAASRLASINWPRPDLLAPGYDVHPFVIAVSRLAAARWLADRGELKQSARLLMWFEADRALDGYRPARRILVALALRERARIAELENQPALARRCYAEFLRRYDLPGPGHRSMVVAARRALERLARTS